jgi:hypothetical protein
MVEEKPAKKATNAAVKVEEKVVDPVAPAPTTQLQAAPKAPVEEEQVKVTKPVKMGCK